MAYKDVLLARAAMARMEAPPPDFPRPMSVQPFCFLGTDVEPSVRGHHATHLVCTDPECLAFYQPEPKPMTLDDARGWAEDAALTCNSCSQDLERMDGEP